MMLDRSPEDRARLEAAKERAREDIRASHSWETRWFEGEFQMRCNCGITISSPIESQARACFDIWHTHSYVTSMVITGGGV